MAKKRYPTAREIDKFTERYVKGRKSKEVNKLKKTALEWMKVAVPNKVEYDVNWLGVPVIQSPQDLVIMQELIFRVRPDVIVETGVAHGGGLVFYASMFELLGSGLVIGIDKYINEDDNLHNRRLITEHPMSKRMKIIAEDSISKIALSKVRRLVRGKKNVLAVFDSGHEMKHVLRELELYSEFITKGNYMVVFDTITFHLAKAGYPQKKWKKYDWLRAGPGNAVKEFLKTNKNFKPDPYYNKFFITQAVGSFLRRVK